LRILTKTNFKGEKIINEYILHEKIGHGAFSKVKRATKIIDDKEAEFAVKIINKDSLFKQRNVRYGADGIPIMINNLDKVNTFCFHLEN